MIHIFIFYIVYVKTGRSREALRRDTHSHAEMIQTQQKERKSTEKVVSVGGQQEDIGKITNYIERPSQCCNIVVCALLNFKKCTVTMASSSSVYFLHIVH